MALSILLAGTAWGAQSSPRAITTFESAGLYWTPPGDPGRVGCQVRFREAGSADWKSGLPMWFDPRNKECRGSLVYLKPGTSYEVELSTKEPDAKAQLTARTWSENFPVAKTVYVEEGTRTLGIKEGGKPDGYVLYTARPGKQVTLDAGDAENFNVAISAPYVIVRGLTLKGAKQDAVRLFDGAHDVVIEDNDISGWGRPRPPRNGAPLALGADMDSGVRADCKNRNMERIVVQRNRIHDPRYGTNSWSFGHPAGPQGITFSYCGGNHVIRHNDITSSEGHYYNDAIGGEDNFTASGFPNMDTDIYGNLISHAWDDGIEAEGGNRNVRIWGNYIDRTAIGIATTVTHIGPVYIFRNVYNRSRTRSEKPLDEDDRNAFAKSGSSQEFGGGRRYLFHNTLLQATAPGANLPLGAGAGLYGTGKNQLVNNTVTRNNIFHVWKPHWESIGQAGADNDFGYDLYNGKISGTEVRGIAGTPIYKRGHGPASEAGGQYELDPRSPGFGAGERLPNFNDSSPGAAPDIGAHQSGTPPMRFGVSAGRGSL